MSAFAPGDAAQRQRLDLLLRTTKAGFLDWDARTGKVSYSDRFKEMLGHPADADTSSWPGFFDLVHPEDRHFVRGRLLADLRDANVADGEHRVAPLEYRLRCIDGGYIWVLCEAIALREHGRTLRYITSCMDISERKRNEQALQDQIELTQAILEHIPNPIFVKDPAGRFIMVNRSWAEMSGLRPEQAIGRTAFELYDPRIAEGFAEEDASVLEQGVEGRPIEYVHRGLKNPDRWRIVRKAVLRRSDGTVMGLVGASTDITAMKLYEEELRASRDQIALQAAQLEKQNEALATEQRRLALVVRAARAGIIDWDGITRSAYYSPRFREMLGYPENADTSGWPDYFDMIHPEDRERVHRRFREHILSGGPAGAEEFHEPIEYRLARADGTYVWVQGMGVSVRDAKGYAIRFIASITDITERRAQDEALRETVRLREEVERISRHDIKTPLNSILAVPRLLREGKRLSREQESLLSIVERAGYRILNMVNQSLDLYKIERGSYQLNAQAVNVADVLDKVIADIGSQASAKRVSMRLTHRRGPDGERQGLSGETSEQPAWAWAEELLCYSIFANLLKNAVEASREGGAVTLSLEEDEGVTLRIHNDGVVPEAVRARFFDKYATAGKSEGTGLGTYSARLMARVQGGDVVMHTAEGNGTTVSVILPAAPAGSIPLPGPGAAGKSKRRAPAVKLPPLRVLVADDDEYNRIVLERYLPSPPLQIEFAVNGKVAVEAAAARRPDVILMDLDMPVMDGYQAVSRVRELERERGTPPSTVIAFTSHDEVDVRRRSREAGCDHFLAKPVSKEFLLETLAELSRPGSSAPHPPAQSAPAGASADDTVHVDAALRDSLRNFLQSRHEALDNMEQALRSGDRQTLRRLSHKLCGSFALYGFAWACEHSRRIELDALQGDEACLAQAIAALRAHLDGARIRFED